MLIEDVQRFLPGQTTLGAHFVQMYLRRIGKEACFERTRVHDFDVLTANTQIWNQTENTLFYENWKIPTLLERVVQIMCDRKQLVIYQTCVTKIKSADKDVVMVTMT